MRRSRYLRTTAISTLAAIAALSAPAFATDSTQQTTASQTGTLWWTELVSAHPDKSREFYTAIAGWSPKIVSAEDTTRPPNPGETDYTLFMNQGTEVAGLSKSDGTTPNEARPGWMPYIQVASVDTAVIEVLKKGGKVLKAPFDDTESGRIAIVEDPDGFAVGLVTPISETPVR